MTTQTLPYSPDPHEEPAGRSYAAAWMALTGFAVLSALIVTLIVQGVAVNHFFG